MMKTSILAATLFTLLATSAIAAEPASVETNAKIVLKPEKKEECPRRSATVYINKNYTGNDVDALIAKHSELVRKTDKAAADISPAIKKMSANYNITSTSSDSVEAMVKIYDLQSSVGYEGKTDAILKLYKSLKDVYPSISMQASEDFSCNQQAGE